MSVIKFERKQTPEFLPIGVQLRNHVSNMIASDLGELLEDPAAFLRGGNETYSQPYKVWVETPYETYCWQSRASVYKYNPENDTITIVHMHESEWPPMDCADIAECLMALIDKGISFKLSTDQWGTVLNQAKYEKLIGAFVGLYY